MYLADGSPGRTRQLTVALALCGSAFRRGRPGFGGNAGGAQLRVVHRVRRQARDDNASSSGDRRRCAHVGRHLGFSSAAAREKKVRVASLSLNGKPNLESRASALAKR